MTGETLNPLLAARGVTVRFGGRVVLEDVDISIRPGEIVTLVGLNGSGKTTLLRALLGLVSIDGGEVRRKKGLRVGYAPQALAIDASMPLTAGRFLSLGGRYSRRKLQEVLNEVGVPRVLDRQVSRLSGGESHRVFLARALLRDPDILLLDEPMSGVDINGKAALYDLLVQIRNQRGCAILLVSHDLSLVMSATDSVVCLNRHVCCTGHPRTIVSDPAFVELFGTELGQSLAVYHHHHDHDHDLSNASLDRNEVDHG